MSEAFRQLWGEHMGLEFGAHDPEGAAAMMTDDGSVLNVPWAPERRLALGRQLLQLPDSIRIVPIRGIGDRMAELADSHRVSTLGAEAVAAAEHLGAHLYVWDGDDGPGIRGAAHASGVGYHTVRQRR
jgi:hypothetical protein